MALSDVSPFLLSGRDRLLPSPSRAPRKTSGCFSSSCLFRTTGLGYRCMPRLAAPICCTLHKHSEGATKFLEYQACTYFCTKSECKNSKCKRDFPRIFIAPLKYLLHKYRVTMLVSLNTKSDFFVRVNK